MRNIRLSKFSNSRIAIRQSKFSFHNLTSSISDGISPFKGRIHLSSLRTPISTLRCANSVVSLIPDNFFEFVDAFTFPKGGKGQNVEVHLGGHNPR